jgi:RNA polymerase-binding protein DksA
MAKAKKRSGGAKSAVENRPDRKAVAKPSGRKVADKTSRKPAMLQRPPAATKGSDGTAARAASHREKVSVKDAAGRGASTRGAGGKGAPASAQGKGPRETVSAKVPAKGGPSKKGAVKPAADGRRIAPAVAPPPRKVQVVQLTTLKPGARGTRAAVASRGPSLTNEESKEAVARRRRSASLTRQQLDHFRELLVQRRARLSHDLSLMQDEALKVTTQDNSSDSVADTGTDNYEQDFTLGLIESEEALAREVDEALRRIDENRFGVCESCQTPVPLARLEILPFARYCVGCQQKREGRS